MLGFGKKGFEFHFILIGIVSLVMATFLYFLIDFVYVPDNSACEFVKYDISGECKDGDFLRFSASNLGESDVFYQINDGTVNPVSSKIVSKGSLEIKVPIRDSSNVKFFPVVYDGGKFFSCSGKVRKLNPEVILRC